MKPIREEAINLLTDSIKNPLKQLNSQFKTNRLQLNSNKTKIVKFNTYKNKEQFAVKILLENYELDVMTTCNGVILVKNLFWKYYIDSLCIKLSACCFQMLILRNSVGMQTRKKVIIHRFIRFLIMELNLGVIQLTH